MNKVEKKRTGQLLKQDSKELWLKSLDPIQYQSLCLLEVLQYSHLSVQVMLEVEAKIHIFKGLNQYGIQL